jgi:glutamate carboxypeptidase
MSHWDTDELVSGIARWAECESPTKDAQAVERMLDIVEAEFAGAPVGIERIPGKDGFAGVLAVRAGPENGQPHALVLSHIDTVHPIGTKADHNPVRIEGDRLYGPGVLDMKGGAYMGMAAFRKAARDGTLNRPTLYLFTPDEEMGSISTRPFIEESAQGAAHVLVTEPARPGGRVVTSRRGSCRYDVFVKGIPAHSGSGQAIGRSAIREAAHQILRIEDQNDEARGVSATIGLINGGTAANTIPEHCWFKVDFRMTEPQDAPRLDAFIRSLEPVNPDVSIRVEGRITRPPYRRSNAIGDLHARVQALGADLGLPLEEYELAGGGSDGNFTAALGIPTIDGLGIEGDGAHTLSEYGLIPTVAVRTALMERLLTEL